MKQQNINPYLDHQEIEQLLPWYVNQTLQESELKVVEAHLSICLSCKRELLQLQKLAHAIIKEGVLDSAEKASFARLKMKLHGQEQVLASQQQAQPSQAKKSFSETAKPVDRARHRLMSITMPYPGLAMAAAALLSVILLMPRSAGDGMQLGNNFKTLSDGQQDTTSADEIRVVFAENVSQQQKDNILGRIHGQIIDAPTAQGVYTVKLNKEIAAKNLLSIVALLRKHNSVIFAEPAYALLSSTHVEK
jgi:Putative zinc-finger